MRVSLLAVASLLAVLGGACVDAPTGQNPAERTPVGERGGNLALTLYTSQSDCRAAEIFNDHLTPTQVDDLRRTASDLGALADYRNHYQFWQYWTASDSLEIEWTVTGGQPPYRIEIDGYDGDRLGPYDRASGGTKIPCVLTSGETAFRMPQEWIRYGHRAWWSPPIAASGMKTVFATVTDASGSVAVAAQSVYVLSTAKSDVVLRRGESYLVEWGGAEFRFTIPEEQNLQMSISGTSEGERYTDIVFRFPLSSPNNWSPWVSYAIYPHTRRGVVYCPGEEIDRGLSTRASSEAQALVKQVFDSLSASVEVLAVSERFPLPYCEPPEG